MTWLFQDFGRLTAVIPFIFSAIISGNPHSPPMTIFILALIDHSMVRAEILLIDSDVKIMDASEVKAIVFVQRPPPNKPCS